MLRGFNRGFSIFYNIEKLLFCFIKLCKCAHQYKFFIFFLKNVRGNAPPPVRQKYGMGGVEDILFSIRAMIIYLGILIDSVVLSAMTYHCMHR